MTTVKIPLSLLAIPFGLAGLGEAWTALAGQQHAPALVGEIILIIAALSWLAVGAAYLSHLITAPAPAWAALVSDLRDPVASPFASLAPIVGVLLASDGLFAQAAMAGRVLTDVFIAGTAALGGGLLGQWMTEPVDLDRFHPGYYLPTVAGGLISADGAALVGQRRLAEVLLGLGVLAWIVLGSLILARLMFRPMLPPPLRPTMAILVAPAAVASLAWFGIHGTRIDLVAAFVAGYGVLMVIAQLRLLPLYLRLPFMPSMWAFTFSWAAVAAAGIIWLQSLQPAGYRVWQYVLITAVTVLVGGIAIRTIIAIGRHQFLPQSPARPAVAPSATPSAMPSAVPLAAGKTTRPAVRPGPRRPGPGPGRRGLTGMRHSSLSDQRTYQPAKRKGIMSRTRKLASAISAGLAVAGLATAAAIGSAGAAVRPASAGAAVRLTSVRPAVTTVAGSVAPFARDTPVTGRVPGTQRLAIELWLRPRTAAATLFAQAVSTPGSARFHQYLSPDAYAARFAATPAAAAAVRSWLRASGFTAISTDPERAYVRATATAATIERAFSLRLKLYRASATVNGGPSALWSSDRPVSLPTALAALVAGVTGLDNAAPAGQLARPGATAGTGTAGTGTAGTGTAAAAAVACSVYYGQHLQGGLPADFGRTSFPTQVCGYSARQLRSVYGANATNTGKGETIALTEEAPLAADDFLALQDYAKVSGLPAPSRARFTEKSAGHGCSAVSAGAASARTASARTASARTASARTASARTASARTASAGAEPAGDVPSPQIEEQLDMEAAYAMAPAAHELLIAGAACGGVDPESQGLINAAQAVVDGTGKLPLATIASNSWKSGPEGQPASETKAEHAILLQAAAEGVGLYFAAGDSSGLNAPADDPYAIAVGGTTLGISHANTRLFETGWSTGLLLPKKGKWAGAGEANASGGGPSVVWKQPAYQRGVVPAALSRVAGRSGTFRSVPDISADGDSDTPMAVGFLSAAPSGKTVFELTPGAGTSLATPLVAGLVADAQQGTKTPFGFLNPVLYKLAGTSALRDVLPLTAASPSLYRAEACETPVCSELALSVFDVRSTNESAGYTGQVTLKGYDNMTGLGTPAGQSFILALRATEK